MRDALEATSDFFGADGTAFVIYDADQGEIKGRPSVRWRGALTIQRLMMFGQDLYRQEGIVARSAARATCRLRGNPVL